MNNHVIIISLLIAIIVAIQIIVFKSTKRKIAIFKQIFPNASAFKIIKVYIPEDNIASSTPDYIFKNINHFNHKPIDSDVSNSELDIGANGHDPQDKSDESDQWVKIQLGYEKKRIKLKNLDLYHDEGWSISDQHQEN